MKRYKPDSFVRVRSKGNMINTAPSDTLRPPLGASAIQPQAWHEGQPTSRPVDNSPLKFHKAARHQLAVITAVGSPFAGPPYGTTHGLSAAQCREAPMAAIPSAQEELGQRFPSLNAGRKIIRHAARSSQWQRGIQEHMALDPQTSAACPRMSPHVQFYLKIRSIHLCVFGGQPKMVVRPIAKLSDEA
jgi:hypothetical protein